MHWKIEEVRQIFLQKWDVSSFSCGVFDPADPSWGCPAGRWCGRPLCRHQHAGCRTQNSGPGAHQGAAEAQQTWYPRHMWRCHPATGNRDACSSNHLQGKVYANARFRVVNSTLVFYAGFSGSTYKTCFFSACRTSSNCRDVRWNPSMFLNAQRMHGVYTTTPWYYVCT